MKKLFENQVSEQESPWDGADLEQKSIAVVNKTQVVVRSSISDDEIEGLGQKHASQLQGFGDKLLKQVRTSDMDVFGDNLNQLVTVAKGLDPTKYNNKGLIRRIRNIFSNVKDKMLAEYSTVESRMNQLVDELDKSATLFQTRQSDLEQMSQDNYNAHKALEASKLEGETMLAQMQAELAVASENKAEDAFAAQELHKLQNRIDRLSKRIDDIHRAMLLSKQIHPQIELLKNNSRTLSSKYRDVKVTTIPAWKTAFSLYIVQMEQKKGAELANRVHDMTDAAFQLQADLLREATTQIAKANQRSVVSIETLEHVQKQLIGSFDDLAKISEEGRQSRKLAETKIQSLEQELITKFLPRKAS